MTTIGLGDELMALIGAHLSSVEFVQDYVQLRFDGPCITAYTMPIVHAEGHRLQVGQAGYRDALCERIGHTVGEIDIETHRKLSVPFDDGSMLTIPLADADYEGPEAFKFTTLSGRIFVV